MEQSLLSSPLAEDRRRCCWCAAALAAVVVVAAILRGYGLFWGFPLVWHCDENTLYGVALRLAHQVATTAAFNPHFNVWGPLALYLLLPAIYLGPLVAACSPAVAALVAGRSLAFAFDIATVLLVYAVGSRAHSRGGAVIAAAVYAVTLLAVREAHFYTVDVLANTALLVYLLLCMKAADSAASRHFLLCGVALGIALSIKQSSLPIVPLGLLAWGVTVYRRSQQPAGSAQLVRRAARRTLALLWSIAVVVAGSTAGWLAMRDRILHLAARTMAATLTPQRLAQHEQIFFDRQLASIYQGVADMLKSATILAWLLAIAATWLAYSRHGVRIYAGVAHSSRRLWAFIGAAAAVFLVLNPYAVLTPLDYWAPAGPSHLTWNILQVAGKLDPPPGWALQFVGTTPYAYQLLHVLPYGMGWPLMLLGIAALVVWTYRLLARRAAGMWLVVAGMLLLIAAMGGMWMKMARYCLPLMPFFALLTGTWLSELIAARRRRRWLGILLAVVGLGSALLWCIAYLNVYRCPDNRAAMLQYIKSHVPAGSVIVVEDDDTWGAVGLAAIRRIPGVRIRVLDSAYLALDYFGRPLPAEKLQAKRRYVQATVDGADYVLLTGLRRERLGRVADQFPVMTQFYDQVFGQRGWHLQAMFDNGPKLFGYRIDDRQAEPTFRLFDHPDVYLFRRVE